MKKKYHVYLVDGLGGIDTVLVTFNEEEALETLEAMQALFPKVAFKLETITN
jgi:hypothetical protein